MVAPSTSKENRRGGSARQMAPILLNWWQANGRKDLPWQQAPTPYGIWVSEIMLQQTQVSTVMDYYNRFMVRFPEVGALAAAPLDEVLHLWSGLGYYARARNLHKAAIQVREQHGGELPEDLDALMALPGIGRSTAGAILAFSTGRRFSILDGNVRRVLARVFAVEGWPGRSAVNRQLWELAEDCTPDEEVAAYTQAIMDLGATVCRRRPDCPRCPLTELCVARAENRQGELPHPKPVRNRPVRAVQVMVVRRRDQDAILLQKRPETGVWGGLWGLPELSGDDDPVDWCRQHLGPVPGQVIPGEQVTHGFTHFELQMQTLHLEVERPPDRLMDGDRWLWYKLAEPARVGIAAPVARILNGHGNPT